jgi:hypothetical protein
LNEDCYDQQYPRHIKDEHDLHGLLRGIGPWRHEPVKGWAAAAAAEIRCAYREALPVYRASNETPDIALARRDIGFSAPTNGEESI